ncbi:MULTISPECIES: DUF3888 domain-containing protein [Clostridium]|jgi:hypothetical protein|uniref:DUF3888 domain-containing protein n=1 Tax=Clostridium thermopalmarium DSM 5974 TaxID=1121340 RepID=A0A2T0ANY5_9CLOT|nr:DUF3888 domain-containing protein [Clostridium thermopalmarium]PRR70728.1 hypothetical protein CPAL_18120 [Clostridium thermopalmarium DSM 5974]PVZ22590.1 uncharacterized protein DUF3888 [Clostridium thermopalmarium DSM 5974]
MKKIVYTVVVFMITITMCALCCSGKTKAFSEKKEIQLEKVAANYCNEALLSFAYPFITKAVYDYYGTNKQFDLFDAKILSIDKPSEAFTYRVIIQINTFTGAHNPPLGTDTITIETSPESTKVINFIHKSE